MSEAQQQQPGAGLDALGGMAAAVDSANPSQEQQQADQQKQTEEQDAETAAQQWGMLMFTVGGFACMIAPELQPVYSEARCLNWGKQANAVAKKYGWNSPDSVPELALIAATAGFAVPTFFILREKLRELKEGKAPDSWLSKFGVWWRTRKARRDVAAMADPKQASQAGANDGGQQ